MQDLTPEQQQELHELRKALEGEFADTEANKDASSAKKDLIDLKPEMLKALKRTMEHGTVEQAAKVAMWGYGKLLDEGKADGDPIRALIAGMPAPATTAIPTASEEDEHDEPSAEAEAKAQDIPLADLGAEE